MSNDCTYVNNLANKNNFDNIDDNSNEDIYKKITDYQLSIKVEGKLNFCFTIEYLYNVYHVFYTKITNLNIQVSTI